jgi:hypothetical protein
VEDFETFLRLDPRSPMTPMALDGLSIALLLARRFDEAVPAMRRAADLLPSLASNFTPMIVAALAHGGRLEDARAVLTEIRPNTLESFLAMLEPDDRDLIRSGIAMARGGT